MSDSLWDGIDRPRPAELTAAGRERFAAEHPRWRALVPLDLTGLEEALWHGDVASSRPRGGVLLTPFHNMALTCPATTEADIDRHEAAFTVMLEALPR